MLLSDLSQGHESGAILMGCYSAPFVTPAEYEALEAVAARMDLSLEVRAPGFVIAALNKILDRLDVLEGA